MFFFLRKGDVARLFGLAACGTGEHFWVTSYFRERMAENALDNQGTSLYFAAGNKGVIAKIGSGLQFGQAPRTTSNGHRLEKVLTVSCRPD